MAFTTAGPSPSLVRSAWQRLIAQRMHVEALEEELRRANGELDTLIGVYLRTAKAAEDLDAEREGA